MWQMVGRRETGRLPPHKFRALLQKTRLYSIELAGHKEIASAHKSGVNSLQIDATEARYLLSGAADGSVAVYDIEQATAYDHSTRTSKHEALFMVDKRVLNGHLYSVSCVHWYPIDTGIFVTGSFDNFVNVWDTNTTQVELQFNMSKKVYSLSMSTLATTHMLIATGTDDTRIRLCDIASGAFTHTLSGHRDSVWVVQWSTRSEWVLVSGGCDGAIRFWDIRRAGCYQILDQQCSQIGRRPPVLKKSSRTHGREDNLCTKYLNASSPIRQRGQKRSFGISAVDSRTAHYGSVAGLQMTADGLHMISAGTDSRLRLWDVESGCNTLVNYPSTYIRGNKGIQMAVTPDSSLVFTPSLNAILVYDVWSGHSYSSLRGHYDQVNCCAFHPQGQELYTGSNDRKILVWAPRRPIDIDNFDYEDAEQAIKADEDAWSD
ncbi:hypothetical protein KP509_16G038600 [Ceratopteris richardii]|uniref:DNA excision repair protein ERCC-8 n=1 Tax=Ceratopteris richardii TaxID=49495 RepID=A0A8T2T2I2_CERRI|nr:hypothetical protein KP509_16G038600 [Ceratopteris richardii]